MFGATMGRPRYSGGVLARLLEGTEIHSAYVRSHSVPVELVGECSTPLV